MMHILYAPHIKPPSGGFLLKGAKITTVLLRLTVGFVQIPQKLLQNYFSPKNEKSRRAQKALWDCLIIKLKWYPQGNSNPRRLREREVS